MSNLNSYTPTKHTIVITKIYSQCFNDTCLVWCHWQLVSYLIVKIRSQRVNTFLLELKREKKHTPCAQRVPSVNNWVDTVNEIVVHSFPGKSENT